MSMLSSVAIMAGRTVAHTRSQVRQSQVGLGGARQGGARQGGARAVQAEDAATGTG